MSYFRGDIYYIERGYASGSEQQSGRPAIIVSNNKCNVASEVVEVVYMTTQPKTDLPTHVTIRSTGKTSLALCEQITSIYKDRIGDFIGTVSDEEMRQIEIALSVSLSLPDTQPKVVEVVKEVPVTVQTIDAELVNKLTEENTELKKLIETLRAKMESVTAEAEMKKSDALYVRAQNDLLMKLYQDQVEKNAKMANTRAEA